MFKKVVLLLFFYSWIVFPQSPAQQIVDSLKLQLRQNPKALEQAKIYADLAWYYNVISIDSALYYGDKSIKMAKTLKDDKLLGQALSDYGAILYTKGDYDQALVNLRQSLAIRTKLKEVEGIASLQYKIANVYFKQFDLNQSMAYYLKALRFYEKNQNAKIVGLLETNIAAVYHALKNYPKALVYLKRSEKYLTETNQQSELANTIVGIGNVYFSQRDTVRAEYQYIRGAHLAEKTQNFSALTTAYNNLGLIYTYQNKPNLAISYISKSLEIRKQVNQTADIASSQLTLAINYNNLGQFSKAKPLLLESLKIFEKDSIRDKMGNVYIQLIPVYASLGKIDSVNYYTNLYLKHAETHLNDNVLKITNELETKYQTEKKEKQLIKKEAEAKEKDIILLFLSLFAVFIALIGYFIYRQQKLKNNQEKQEHELKLAITKIETQNKLQEQRLNISRDLHDNIGAQLTFIISSVDNIKYGFNVENPKLSSKLNHISTFTKSTIIELRDTIWAMNSNAITFEDLELRIMNFIEKAKQAKENIDFRFEIASNLNAVEFTSIVGMNIYRTIQESVNNAIKYANAKVIGIEIKEEADVIKIIISDDGTGFDISNTTFGNGLSNMKKRIGAIGGTFEINSELEKGTIIKLSINKK